MFRVFKRFRNETTNRPHESSPLVIHVEAHEQETSRVSSLSELELNFKLINENVSQNLSNYESLKVIECSKFESALESVPFFVREFFIRFDSALCLHFVIDDEIKEPMDFEFFKFYNSLKDFSGSFVIVFENEENSSNLIYWRLANSLQIFSLHLSKTCIGFCNFLKEFFIRSLKSQHNGIHPLSQNYPTNRIKITTPASLLADDKCINLLHLAARDGKLELIKYLVNVCDMNLTVDGKTAIELAHGSNQHEVVHLLLSENSRFPRNFEVSSSMSDELQNFVKMSEKLHEAIKVKDHAIVEQLVNENSNLRFFYDTQNRSALNVALTWGAFDMYKFLMTKNCALGPHEIYEDLLKKLSSDQREELTEIVEEMYKDAGDKHILMLMSNTQVGPDDKQARLSLVCDALQKLNTIPGIKILLQIVAATRNFQLIFDFNREHILFLQPAEEGYVTGLFDICGRIYIGAQHLLNPSRAHEVLGVIAHELCHYVMWIVFKNTAKPYEVNDEVKRARFDQILAHCKQNSNLEGIIALVFSQYGEDMHVAELIVRVPHALGLYIDEPEKLEEFRVNYEELNKFYEETMLVMQEKLPKIEEKAENRIRKENSSPLNFLKYHWKKILFGLFLIGLLSFFITFIARSCLFKSCGDSRAFCVFEHFTAVCKCPQNANETLYWEANKCNQCLIDAHCHTNESCFINNCFNSRNVFTCADRSKRMFSSARCDGKKDCDDGSDESYHCITGILEDEGTRFKINVEISANDFLIFINESTENCYMLYNELNSKEFQLTHLPVNISKILPNLKTIDIPSKKLERVGTENFDGLFKLIDLILHYNNIQDVGDSLRDLHSLEALRLSSNRLTHLAAHWFVNLRKLELLYLTENSISSMAEGVFDNLVSLRELYLLHNQLNELRENVFRNLISLIVLDLRYNSIKSLHPNLFDNLGNLGYIYLSGNPIKTVSNPLFKDCNNVMAITLSTFGQSLRLESISENAFEGCYNLENLDLSSNNLTKIPVKLFTDLKSLGTLIMRGTPSIMDKINASMLQNMKKLRYLDISECNLKTIPDGFLNNFERLEKFYCAVNDITHLQTSWFKSNKRIQQIDFDSNSITKIDEDFIDNMKYLRSISLIYNRCTGKAYGNTVNRMSAENRTQFKNDISKC